MGKDCRVSKLCVTCVVLAVISVATIVTLWTIALTSGGGEDVTSPWDQYRLPKTLVPEHYNVSLWPRLTKDSAGLYIFTGKSLVVFTCVEETDLILIHSNKLNYTLVDGQPATLSAVGGSAAPTIKSSRLQTTTQYLVLQLSGKLTKGTSYQLDTEFQGELADDLAGFYRSEYNEDGERKIVATSQMHPTHARKTFPCFDEPAMKAVFHITLIHPPGTVALSNGKEHQVINVTVMGCDIATQTSFEPTERMSTYLLALIISDFSFLSSQEGDVQIRIWARRSTIAGGQGSYALNLTGPVLSFFEEYYNITYPLSKSGAPDGFPSGYHRYTSGQISQKHFLLDPDSVVTRPSQFKYEWMIPVTWMKSGMLQEPMWLMMKDDVNPAMEAGGEWILANLNVTGYYRVNYDYGNWERILLQLSTEHQIVPLINRAQLVDDAFNLARAKLVPTTLALRTTMYLSLEREYLPWQSAVDNLDYLRLMFDRTEVYGPMKNYIGRLVTPLFLHFKNMTSEWTEIPEGHTDQYNQVNAIRTACSTGEQECVTLTSGWYQQWMNNPENNPIHPNLRSAVYCSAMASGGIAEWEFGWTMFRNATVVSEADTLMSALACTTDHELLKRYLRFSLDPEQIRKQDASAVIVSVSSNVEGQGLAWDFLRENWTYMFTQYGVGSFSFASLITGVTRRFSTTSELEQLQSFQQAHSAVGFGSASQALEQALETTRANIRWVEDNAGDVLDWFLSETA
ncbi:aminopeptidase Ey-like [Osmerus eperlanus]|uniref:aminopeptidase Ey-like n=1 Tax=Osmerus eperlanus TaxID=29151 RepID=UPI002E0F8339